MAEHTHLTEGNLRSHSRMAEPPHKKPLTAAIGEAQDHGGHDSEAGSENMSKAETKGECGDDRSFHTAAEHWDDYPSVKGAATFTRQTDSTATQPTVGHLDGMVIPSTTGDLSENPDGLVSGYSRLAPPEIVTAAHGLATAQHLAVPEEGNMAQDRPQVVCSEQDVYQWNEHPTVEEYYKLLLEVEEQRRVIKANREAAARYEAEAEMLENEILPVFEASRKGMDEANAKVGISSKDAAMAVKVIKVSLQLMEEFEKHDF